MPSCQAWLVGGRKRRVAQSGNLHWCGSHYKFVIGDLGTWMLSISVNGQHIPFPAPLVGSCFKSSSGKLRSSCRDLSQQGPQGSLVRELVTGDPMAHSVVGWPCNRPLGVIAHRQIWQLSPRLEQGHVESIYREGNRGAHYFYLYPKDNLWLGVDPPRGQKSHGGK